MTIKPFPCPMKCGHTATLTTKIDAEGFSIASGWGPMRDHIDREHPEFSKKLDAYINDGPGYRLPYEEIEAEWVRSQEACGREVA